MCGIALVSGQRPDPARFRNMLGALEPRGEVTETASAVGLLAGVRRLRITDPENAAQPLVSADRRWVLCFNGEVFNYRELRAGLSASGRTFRTDCDTEVVLESFLHWGVGAVRRFRGEFAFAIADTRAGRVYLARDPLGVKPLYYSRADGCLHIASEVKALVPAGAPVTEVPPGHHGWMGATGGECLVPYRDFFSPPGCEQIADPALAARLVRATLADSIRVRVDTGLTVGVILSGGLDSSLTLAHVRRLHPDCVALTVGVPGSEDVAYARRLAADLRVPHEVVEVHPRDIGREEVREAIRMSELTEYGDIINAVVSVPLFRRARQLGIKIVLTGDGSDELFGGYPMYQSAGPGRARALSLHKISSLGRTELQRVDRISLGHGVEARVPFLDPAMVDLAMRLPMELKVRGGQEKWILRYAFAGLLPGYVLARPKNPMSYSSGLHERVRLFRPLFARIYRSLGYDLLDCVRRDFSRVLADCGHDLDLALARAQARPDHTVAEHARDLIGALRQNALPRRTLPPRHARLGGQPVHPGHGRPLPQAAPRAG
jgi:asparagine synthase (glutamine-hydrolysing)